VYDWGWQYYQTYVPFVGWVDNPVPVYQITGHHWERTDGSFGAATRLWGPTADTAEAWQPAVRDALWLTYVALKEFKEACKCACPKTWGWPTGKTSSGPAEPDKEVKNWLEKKYPNPENLAQR